MRMLLTSGGISNDAIHGTLVELLGKPTKESKIVVIIDAMLGLPGDKSTMLEHLTGIHSLGWEEYDLMSLFSAPPAIIERRLREADVIFCYGGSNHWLAHAWTSNGFGPLLRELLDEKVYVGWSAGSIIFSTLHQQATEAYDDQEEVEFFGLQTAAPALPLLDWWLSPHLGASFFPHETDEWAADIAPRFGGPVWFLDDDSALLVRDPDAEPEVISSGHWLQYDAHGRLVASA